MSLFNFTATSGTNGAAETPANSFNVRQILTEVSDDLDISLASNALTFGTTGIYGIKVVAENFSASGTRFIHKLFKNAVATGLPSIPIQTDAISNWSTISYNILSLTAGDVIEIKGRTNSTTSSLRGKAFNLNTEVYLNVEVELLASTNHALFYYSKAANTAGDNEVATYTGRALTAETNTITGLVLTTDTITFPVGNFRIRTLCTHSGVSGRRFVHKFVDPSTPAIGNNIGNCVTETISFLNVATGTVDHQFKSKADATTGTPTMGKVGNLGEIEIYGLVEIKSF